jgi:uncharacterized membrane protein YccC
MKPAARSLRAQDTAPLAVHRVPAVESIIPSSDAELQVIWQSTLEKVADLNVTIERLRQALTDPRRKRIYAIRRGQCGPIKIGMSNEPQTRLRNLQTAVAEQLHLLAVIDGDEQVERDLHRRFEKYRLHGEWFSPNPEVLSWVRSIGGTVDGDDIPTAAIQLTIFSNH